jgi:hypothetical protein
MSTTPWTTTIGKENGINLLNAYAQWHFGTTEPVTTYPFQNWGDTTTNLWKQRNETDDGWVIKGILDQEGFGLPVYYKASAPTSTFAGMIWGDTTNNLNWRRDSTDTSWNLWYPIGTSLLQTSGWVPFAFNGSLLTVSYASSSTVTVAADLTNMIQKGYGFFYKQSGTYTNDPSAGSSVVLDMTDTIGAVVGNKVTISSSAGSETTTITAVTTNTSITVATLALNHTTTNPVVTIWKYAYIVDVSYSNPNTTLTLAMGSDFNLVNATISNPYWTPNPQVAFGFPDVFNYTVIFTGFSSNPTSVMSRFSINGSKCLIQHMEGVNGTSNATTFTISLPIPSITLSGYGAYSAANGLDNGVQLLASIRIVIQSGATIMIISKDWAGGSWTASGEKRAWGINIWYEY